MKLTSFEILPGNCNQHRNYTSINCFKGCKFISCLLSLWEIQPIPFRLWRTGGRRLPPVKKIHYQSSVQNTLADDWAPFRNRKLLLQLEPALCQMSFQFPSAKRGQKVYVHIQSKYCHRLPLSTCAWNLELHSTPDGYHYEHVRWRGVCSSTWSLNSA